MDRDELLQEIQGALLRLYDYPYLATRSALSSLAGTATGQMSAAALSQALVEGIERLQPGPGLPSWSRPWRHHAYLQQRYVQMKSVKEVSRALGISERQSQRVNLEAIERLAAQLFPSWQEPGNREPAATESARADLLPTDEEPGLAAREVARLAEGSGAGYAQLGDVLAGVMATVDNMARSRHVSLAVNLEDNLPPIAVERTLLRQGLLSLLVACLEYGAQEIDLAARAAAETVVLTLRSTVGLDDGTRPQAETSPGRSLRLARELLAPQSVLVDLQEDDGRGFCLEARFPCREVPTVLIVDDNPDTIRLYRRYLGGQAYKVVEAHSGPQAVHLARQLQPAAITLDVMMPGQDGWETLQRIHNHPQTHDIPVLICSVIDQQDLALSLGAVGLLAKPVSRTVLLQALARCLAAPAGR
jgi:CheY-like chemotaxis protein